MNYPTHLTANTTSNNSSKTSNNNCIKYSTPSSCRTEYETPIQILDFSTPSSHPTLSAWAFSSNSFTNTTPLYSRSPTMPTLPIPSLSTSYRDPLRSTHGSPRVTKVDHHHPYQHQQHHNHHQRESSSETDIYPYNRRRSSNFRQQSPHDSISANNANVNMTCKDSSVNNSRWHSSPSPPSSPRRRHINNDNALPRRISISTSPRSNGRLPSLFDRIKAALEAPKRPTINTAPFPPIRTNLNLAQLNEEDPAEYPSPTNVHATTTTATTTTSPSHLHPCFTNSGYSLESNKQHTFECPPIVTKPELFGFPCSEACYKAYSRHSSDVKMAFKKLQQEDCGTVENRTIAFSTHLTISRWEPIPANTPSSTTNDTPTAASANDSIVSSAPQSDSTASTLSGFAEETASSRPISVPQQLHGANNTEAAPPEQPPLQPQRDNPVYTVRLISLANYIRHIISLSSGNSPLHSQSTLVQQRLLLVQRQQLLQQYQRQQQKLNESRPSWSAAYKHQQGAASLPSPLSAGPGPIKNTSLSTRKHRQISEYHGHAARRQHHHQQQLQSSITTSVQDQQVLPSPTSPVFQNGRRSSQPQQQLHNMAGEQSTAATSPKLALTLPKVPYPNLTLTLALIYVDRLKEKNPAAKGEPGCSHRLFLVAYIIAAKYRCSVELAALLEEQHRLSESTSIDITHKESFDQVKMNNSTDKEIAEESECDGEVKPIDQRINEARSRAEVILSNQSWVQLLSLGSFMRAMPVASQPTNTSLTSARTSPTQPMNRQVPTDITGTIESDSVVEAKPLPIQSTLTTSNSISVDSRPMENLAITQTQTLTPASNSSPVLPPSSVLQVDDLDRMESEFLTFLDYDLAARSQDLDTCWGLLVGNKSY